MAGTNVPRNAPYPNGPFIVTMGGYLPNGAAGAVIDVFTLPFDCYIDAVWYTYRGGTAHLDAVGLASVDGTKNIVASADMSADVLGVKQSLHADCKGLKFVTGDQLKLIGSSDGANESGDIKVRVALRPATSSAKATEV